MKPLEKALTERPFPQIPFKSTQQFSTLLHDRGFRLNASAVNSLVEGGLIKRLKTESGEFHPFQIWPVCRLFKELQINLDSAFSYYGWDESGFRKYIDYNWPRKSKRLMEFPESEQCKEFNIKIFPLLLWLESIYLPVIRGPRPGIVHVSGWEAFEWLRWNKQSVVENLLDDHSLTVDQVTEFRRQVLVDAFNIDPARQLYLLLRSMPYEQRDQFRGQLRLAYDLYEMAEILRMFLEQVSEKPVVKEWDPTGSPEPPWVKRIYGSQPEFGSPKFLRGVVRHFGLDPAFRVRWLVEGKTEEGFITEYLKNLGAVADEFITVQGFGGDGSFTKQIPAIDAQLRDASKEQCFVTLTFDEDSQKARARADCLKKQGLVNFPYVLNNPDFELANFSVEQLVSVAKSWAEELKYDTASWPEDLIERVEQRLKQKKEQDFKRALDAVLHLIGSKFRLSKNYEWGQRLAQYLIEDPDNGVEKGSYSEEHLTKIERQILCVLRNSQPSINYPASIGNLNPDTLELT